MDARRRHEAVRASCDHPAGGFVEFPREAIQLSLVERFEQQVRRYPERLAVKTREHELTYAALNAEANRLAHAIVAQRGEAGEPVALLIEKSAPQIAAMLATLKAGKAYMLIDPRLPPARIQALLEDARPGLVLTNSRNEALGCQVVEEQSQLLNGEAVGAGAAADDLRLSIPLDTPAYLVYTSGSTGKPKGVVRSHRSMMWIMREYTNRLRIAPADRLTLLGTQAPDTFCSLLNGAAVFPLDVRGDDVLHLAGWLNREQITVYHSVPTLFRQLVGTLTPDQVFPWLRLIRLQGEPVQWRDVELFQQHFAPSCLLINSYGISETGPIAQYFIDHATPIGAGRLPVGPPCDDLDLLLLDEQGQSVPPGEPGEIAVRSRYLASGYWRNPELTRVRFLPDPNESGTCVYLTGDQGRRLLDGMLLHEGRTDFQVKVRGHRIEPGEIEAALLDLGLVQDAVVVARADEAGESRLVAYVVPGGPPGERLTVSALRRALAPRLPEALIPSVFVLVETLPRTVTGKVDRRALPVPSAGRPELDTPFAPPRTAHEARLVEIWREVLGLDEVGIHDNFFELGGHSVLAARLFTQIQKRLGKELPLAAILHSPTVALLAPLIQEEGPSPLWSSLVPIQPHGSRPPLFCMHANGGGVLCYRELAHYLGSDQPVYGLQAQGLDGKQPRHTRVEAMAAHYVREMRALQPTGPYFLTGLSFGGLVAFEVAQQLHAQGQSVALLALLDTSAPGQPHHAPLIVRIAGHLPRMARLGPQRALAYFWIRANGVKTMMKTSAWRFLYQAYLNSGRTVPDGLQHPPGFSYLPTIKSYLPQVYPGTMVLFRAMERSPGCRSDQFLGWGDLVQGGVETHAVPGSHVQIIEEPHVRVLAEKLKVCLDRAQAGAESCRGLRNSLA
jgi:amino acid adenylation domain-containing protein